jgi:signal transduction histidine kinase
VYRVNDSSLHLLTAWIGVAGLVVMLVILWRQHVQGRRMAERSRELERLSLELIRANRMKSEFLANISHELRTPLNAIVGFIDLLQEGVYGQLTERQSLPVQRIQHSATHLRHLVDQVLDLAKVAAGRMEMHPEPVDLQSFLQDVLTEVESLARERSLSTTIESTGLIPKISTDPVHLRQILVNLVGNAIKFTERGAVRIALRHEYAVPSGAAPVDGSARPRPRRWWVTVAVCDTGIGIAPTDHARVFDEFEQVNVGARGDSMRQGTGLGLPISRRLAHLMGGTITLESEPGKGSTFTLWLPAQEGAALGSGSQAPTA